jgi:VCBS repeat protein
MRARGRCRSLVRAAIPLLAFCLATGVPSPAPAGPTLRIRDVGVDAGLDPQILSFGIQVRDYDDDGWDDLLLMHHSGPTQLMHNTGGGGFELATRLVDTIHEKKDRHDCAWGDVNQDGMDDIYCTKGAHLGTAMKWNELWMQGPAGTYTDEAAAYGVTDRWGRGRLAAFIDLNHDAYPDLFVGNEYPRHDDKWSPDRTYLNVGGEFFTEVRMGLTREIGARCAQVLDVDGDGWDDLLLCGKIHLFVFLRKGGRFVQNASALGVAPEGARSARIARLDVNDRLDLVVVRQGQLEIQHGRRDGTFGPVRDRWLLRNGTGLAVGDVDGIHGNDILAVQGCVDGVNQPDSLFVNRGSDRGWYRMRLTGDVIGCGDVAAAIDFDRDGKDDFVVMNGRPIQGGKGPDQLLTAGDWTPP